MREIKFRAWNKSKNIMVYNDEDDSRGYWEGVYCNNIQMVNARLVNSGHREYVWLQFTGLNDMNGKKIFNGDIVERKGIKYQITLEIGSFLLVKIDENTDMYEEFVDCWNDHVYPLSQLYWNNSDEENHIYDLEVIGNIYENPELLEATA